MCRWYQQELKQASFTEVHTVLLLGSINSHMHANLPVMILNVIFLISYGILKVLFTFYWKQTKMHIQYLGHITHMSVLQLASFNNIWLQGKRKQGKST